MADQDWLNAIYRSYRRPLYLTAWNVLRCPSLAEDAVHSAFVRLAELSKPPRDPKAYAFRAVRNTAIDLARARGRRQEVPIPVEREPQDAVDPPLNDESLVAVSAALAQLDERAREVVELRLHGHLTFEEIATICDEPLQTVAARYRRALEKLRQKLEVFHG